MKRSLKKALALTVALIMCAVCAGTVFAEDDPVIYYFVDCGDYLTDTVSEGDSFGMYNTVTDQFFGADPGTGRQWGVVDEAYDEATSTSYGDTRVITTWTWAYEYNTAGTDVPKEQSNRYCHNMSENGLDRVITYKFEMPEDGEYVVEVGFACPWGNSSPVDFYLNGELAYDTVMIDSGGSEYAYATVSPVDGYITVEAKSVQPTINMSYIIISNVLTNEETTNWEDFVYKPDTGDETDAETEAPATDGGDNDGNGVVNTSGDNTPADSQGSGSDSGDKTEESGCGSTISACAAIFAITSCAAVAVKKRKIK